MTRGTSPADRTRPRRHPPQEILSAYGCGTLGPGHRLAIRVHCELCPSCSDFVRDVETAGGILLDQIAPAELAPNALDRALAALSSQPAPEAKPDGPVPKQDMNLPELPECLRGIAMRAIVSSRWQFSAPGVRALDLAPDGGPDRVSTQLVRIDPGRGIPRHDHTGREWTLVLSGAFADETGTYGPGDLCIVGPGVTHRPIGMPAGPCYALTVTEGSPAFTGALGLVQRAWNSL